MQQRLVSSCRLAIQSTREKTNLDLSIESARDDVVAIAGEAHGRDLVIVLEGLRGALVSNVPELDGAIVTATDHKRRALGHGTAAVDNGRVAHELLHALASLHKDPSNELLDCFVAGCIGSIPAHPKRRRSCLPMQRRSVRYRTSTALPARRSCGRSAYCSCGTRHRRPTILQQNPINQRCSASNSHHQDIHIQILRSNELDATCWPDGSNLSE